MVTTMISRIVLMERIQIGRDQVRQIRDIMAMGSIVTSRSTLMGGISSSIRQMVVVSWVGRRRCFTVSNTVTA
jgi:hypothetical protein